MESEKEFKEELKESLPIYKIAGIIIGVLLLIGVIFALITEFRPRETPIVSKVVPTSIPTQVPDIAPPTQNITETATPTISTVIVPKINATSNTTKITNTTVVTIPTLQPTLAPEKNSWSSITVNFPDKLKKITSNITSYHYIAILEGDRTPVTNGEQFEVAFFLDDHRGLISELKENYEGSRWLIQLLLPNPGTYTLKINVACADKNGYCKRFYPAGSVEKTFDFEVV